MPTGTITQEKLATMPRTVREQFRIEIEALKKTPGRPMGLGKKQIEDLCSGHDDGMRNIVMALRAAGVLVVEE